MSEHTLKTGEKIRFVWRIDKTNDFYCPFCGQQILKNGIEVKNHNHILDRKPSKLSIECNGKILDVILNMELEYWIRTVQWLMEKSLYTKSKTIEKLLSIAQAHKEQAERIR
jgi:competence CoiA-like predicted nuclease